MTFTTVAILFNCEFMPRSCLVIAETVYVDLHLFTDSSSISTVDCTWLMLWALNSGYCKAIWLFAQDECDTFGPTCISSYYSMATVGH